MKKWWNQKQIPISTAADIFSCPKCSFKELVQQVGKSSSKLHLELIINQTIIALTKKQKLKLKQKKKIDGAKTNSLQ